MSPRAGHHGPNLGFKLTPRMTVGEIYYEFARALEVEAWKYKFRRDRRIRKNGRPAETPEEWFKRAQRTARTFVNKVVLMVEHMELPE